MPQTFERITIETPTDGHLKDMVKLHVQFGGGKTLTKLVSKDKTWLRALTKQVESSRPSS